DPGIAFGSGEHPSTRLAVTLLEEALARLRRRGRDDIVVYDAGTGSGIVAIAAAKLGAAAYGIDLDPLSVNVARANAARNGLAERVVFERGDATEPPASRTLPDAGADVIVANILKPVLTAAAPALAGALAPGGALILSGITVEQRDRLWPL